MEKFELRKRYRVDTPVDQDAIRGLVTIDMLSVVAKDIETLEKMLDAEMVCLKNDLMVEIKRIKNAKKS